MHDVDYHRLAAQAHYLRSKMVREAVGRLWRKLTQGSPSTATSH